MPDVPTLTLNNGVTLPAIGFGVFQTPPDETRSAVAAALSEGYRHIDTAAAYGNERQVGDAVHGSGLDRSDVFLETKIWISDYGYEQTLHGFEKSARKLGVDQIDLLILHQALPSDFEATLGGVPSTGDAPGRRQGPGHRCQQLHGRAPHAAARPVHRGPGRQPDRGPPLLQPARRPGRRGCARHPHPGLVPHRRHHVLPRRPARKHPSRPGDRRHRRDARQDPGPGDAALAPAAGTLRYPQVHERRTASPRTSTCSTSSSRTRISRPSMPSTPVMRGGPEPEAITLEAFGREIPEE